MCFPDLYVYTLYLLFLVISLKTNNGFAKPVNQFLLYSKISFFFFYIYLYMVSTALILIALNLLLVLNSYLYVLNVFNNIYMAYFK